MLRRALFSETSASRISGCQQYAALGLDFDGQWGLFAGACQLPALALLEAGSKQICSTTKEHRGRAEAAMRGPIWDPDL